jgi:hypothetical protein
LVSAVALAAALEETARSSRSAVAVPVVMGRAAELRLALAEARFSSPLVAR